MYIDNLKATINTWLSSENTDEWLFASFRDSNVKLLEPYEAYSLIDDTVDILLKQTDRSASIEVLETILCLARTSCTTEVPQSIQLRKTELDSHFSESSKYSKRKLNELYKYYRL